jgi:hypothetical protein
MRRLHRATLSFYTDLSLDGTLRRIVQAARDLTEARYAALAVPDGKGGLAMFLTEGLSQAEAARIPHAHGVGLIDLPQRALTASGSAPSGPPFPRAPHASFLARFGSAPRSALPHRARGPEFTEEDQNYRNVAAPPSPSRMPATARCRTGGELAAHRAGAGQRHTAVSTAIEPSRC